MRFFNLNQEKISIILWCFVSLCILYVGSYVLQILGKNFSITLFAYKIYGICLLAFVIFCFYILPLKIIRFLAWITVLLCCFFFLVDLFCFVVFQSTLSEAMLATAIETNFAEICAFFSLYVSMDKVIVGLLLAFGLFFFFFIFIFRYCFSSCVRLKKILPLYVMLCLIGCFGWGYELFLIKKNEWACQYRNHLIFITPMRNVCYLYNAQKFNVISKQYVKKYREIFDNQTLRLDAKNKIENIVIILGESLSRNHMEIYGYPKSTNPLLKSYVLAEESDQNQFKNQILKKEVGGGELVIFNNVISPHAQTTLSLRKILTYLNYENEKNMDTIYEYGNLISVFNLAGYTTFWVSNQMDKNNGIVGTIASFASYTDFVSRFKQTFDDVFFDEAVLGGLDKIFSNATDRNLYVIHLMGSHASYGNRYPKEFSFFDDSITSSKTRTVSRYDNSVRYNDYVIYEIFKRFSGSDSIVLYISDHAEELYDLGDFLGHSDDRISRFMVEIPMLVYCSKLFIEKHPEIYRRIIQARKYPYMTDDFIHTVLDIAGIETPIFDKTRSVINKDFNIERTRRVGGIYGKDYDKEMR